MNVAAAVLVTASARTEVADFLSALLTVYLLLIIAFILQSLYFGFGGKMPTYNRAFTGVLDFLNQVVTPYLNLFRRVIPPLGPIDLSALVAIIVLQIVGGLLVGIVRG